jgi:protein SSD1
MEITSRSVNDESALFDDDGEDEQIVVNRTGGAQGSEKEASKQRLLSLAKVKPVFEGLRITAAGHRIQEIKELMNVPVSNAIVPAEIFLICYSIRLSSPPI